MSRMTFCLLLGVIFSYALFSFLLHTPFIQNELVGQAFWYACDGSSFLETLFEPFKNDEFPGRFRYVEYAFEALYWNLVKKSFLPKSLYDYSAIGISTALSFLLYQICKLKKLSRLNTLLILSLFILSIPTFMIVNFHYRKAKFIVTLLFAIIIYKHALLANTRKFSKLIFLCTFIGVFTDPYFILLIPLITTCLDYSKKNWASSRSGLIGLTIAGLLVVLTNGWIGPHFNSNTQLLFSKLQYTNSSFLNLNNLRHTYGIVLDTLTLIRIPQARAAGWLLLVSLVTLGFYLFKRKIPSSFFWLWLLSLPIGAFLVNPDPSKVGMFLGYYGHPIFFLFTLAVIEYLKYFQNRASPLLQPLGALTILTLIYAHQNSKEFVFSNWQLSHLKNPDLTENIFKSDETELMRLKQIFKHPKATAETLVDYSNLRVRQFGNTHLVSHPNQHSNLAYIFIPILFDKELKEGRLKIYEPLPGKIAQWTPICGQTAIRF